MGRGMKERWRAQFFVGGGGYRVLPSPSLGCKFWSPIKSTLRSVLGLITVIILKRVRDFTDFTTLQHVSWRSKVGSKIFDL